MSLGRVCLAVRRSSPFLSWPRLSSAIFSFNLIINVDYSISAIVCDTAILPSWQDKLSIGRMLPWNALKCLHHQDKSKCAQLYSKLRCTHLYFKSNMHICIQNSNVQNCMYLCTTQVQAQTSRGCSIGILWNAHLKIYILYGHSPGWPSCRTHTGTGLNVTPGNKIWKHVCF